MTTARIRRAKGLTDDAYVPRAFFNNTMTVVKATMKMKRGARDQRKRLREEREERELEQAGSFWTEPRELEQNALSSKPTENANLEDKISHLTMQVSQLHTLMSQMVDGQARLAGSGGLAFRMP